MQDFIGRILGHYRIAEKIGEGGMGVVYRAHDERLDRDVAIKVLHEAVAQDVDRLARFEREAKLLASLSHQNIAALHGFEEDEGQRFLVMELAEGETLADRIKKGPVSVDEALEIARQIAEGLEAAHEQGIIHRDLKPANVMLSPEGRVKVLDFGLAKAWRPEEGDADLTHSPTLTAQMTAAGVLLGTAAYMSPEQARGKPVEKRTDVWSFGCVLFEMLTGATCYQGETVSDTIAGILTRAPEWESLPASTPPRVHRLLRRCLEKDPRRRLRDIGEARITLEDSETGAVRDGRDDGGRQFPISKRPWRALPWVIAAATAATAAAAVALGWVASRPELPRTPARLAVDLPSDLQLSITLSTCLAVSPDGSRLAFVASRDGARPRLYLRELSRFGASSIPGTEGADGPFFSPDGQWIAFFADKKLRKVSVMGGAPLDICEVPQLNPGATWGADGTIVFSSDRFGLMRIPASGGTAEQLTAPKLAAGEIAHAWPSFLPDGHHLLFTVWGSRGHRIALLSLGTGEWRELVAGRGAARYLLTDHLLYTRAGGLTAIGFNLDRLEPVGQPFPILEDVYAGPGPKGFGLSTFSVSDTGVLAYVPGGAAAAETRLVWVDRQGRSTLLAADPGSYEWPRLSPDGSRVAVTDRTADGAIDVWILGVERGTRSRLTVGGGNITPTWAPGGEEVFFGRTSGPGAVNIYRKRADGVGEAEQVLVSEHSRFPRAITADGRSLLFVEWNPETARDIWTMMLEGDQRAEPVLATPFDEYSSALSSDGRWLAYVSDESGRYEVYVRSWPAGASRVLVSAHGGKGPAWSADGTELFYRDGEAMMVVPVESGTSFSAGAPELLFEGRFKLGVHGSMSYDVSADGRFLMIEPSRDKTADRLHVVLDWFEELKRLVPTK